MVMVKNRRCFFIFFFTFFFFFFGDEERFTLANNHTITVGDFFVIRK